MTPAQLEAARQAAITALGRTAHHTLARLTAAGLTVVRTADLPPHTPTLKGVRLTLREPWDGHAPIWAERPGHPDGDILVLTVHPDAVPAIREAALLQHITRTGVTLTLNAEGHVTAAWTDEA
ncbi:hypothetical protein [Deinococcus aquiradiocola]|uniref:Uncharacterized protein n=1 Tax=Deinococcus aquiradiocola TaxID=393059 RepID=A0A917P7H9_9DEIO|nr:hypothetical protein [Deinococcus aquiradiocola]GGJ65507.1 hypothetical protein GCM10008939_06840 [Deinococcus aquiradiocola]